MFTDFFKDLWVNHKKDIIEVIIMICLLVWALLSMQKCSDNRNELDIAKNNIVAITDTATYYKAKNGELVAQKTIIEAEYKDLLNVQSEEIKSLTDELNNMKRKNAQFAAQIKGYIENPPKDTVWKYDTTIFTKSIVQPFDFSNKYRKLDGNIIANNDILGLNIKNDIVIFNYTVAVEDGLVYISSDNPYVKYNSLTAIQEPPKKPKRWNVGVQLGIGFQYGLFRKQVDLGPYLGVGVSWGFGF